MKGTSLHKEEIERKRQEALNRQKQKTASTSNAVNNYTNQNVTPNSSFGISKSFGYSNKVAPTSYKSSSFSDSKSAYKDSQNKSQSSYKAQSSSNRYNPIGAVQPKKFYGIKQVCEASCSMVTPSRFAVDMSIYHQQLIELFKTIPSRHYDAQTKIWDFHLNEYDLVHEKIISLKADDIVFKGIPSFLLKTFRNLLLKENGVKPTVDISQINSELLNSLYVFQREGIEYGISKNGRCLIADDMGLGKTRQALGIAEYYKSDWPLIIITPSSVRYQWADSIVDNIPSVPIQSIQNVATTKDYLEKSQITIISYDLLTRRIDELSARKYGVIICDESHYLKSAKTQRTKAVGRLAANAKRIILLTGTPALSRPIELHPQIKLLIPSFMSFQEFGMRYCSGMQTNFGWDFTGSSNLKELDILLKASCLIRRLKSDVMKELPSKIREKIILDPDLIKTSSKKMTAASENVEKESLSSSEKRSALLQYYSETSKAKEKAVCNYIADLLENQEKFLVFAHHHNMLDAISELLTSKKIMFIRIDGKTHAEQRKNFVDLFQQDPTVLVAVLSITAANAGITLTAARLVVFAELTWNPGILCQAEDRVHRIGQSDNVVIRYLLAKRTADDYLWPGIQKKIDVLNEAGLEQNFDLNKADVAKQVNHNQQTIDDMVDTSQSSKVSNTQSLDASGNAELHTSSESLKDLLDIDDDAFNDIDLDNITA